MLVAYFNKHCKCYVGIAYGELKAKFHRFVKFATSLLAN